MMANGSQKVTTYSSNTLIPKLNSASLSNFTDSQNLIYTYYGGDNSIDDKPTSVDAFGVMSFKTASGWYGQLLMSSNNATGLYWRTATSLSGGWHKLLDSSNYTDYTVTKTGSGASGTWSISISGNAATATRINGNLAAATSDVNRNIWVSSTASADGIPNYISGFNMNPSTKIFTVPAGTRISPSAGSLYLGNSGNQGWVYVQDMCSQDGQKWKIHQNGNAEFNGTVTAPTFNGNSTTTSKLLDSAHSWTATEVYNYMTARVLKAGDTMSGTLAIVNNTQNSSYNALLYIGHASNNDWGEIISKGSSYDYGLQVICKSDGAYGISVTGRITGTKVYSAVWNDYAECRSVKSNIEAGRVVYETNNRVMQLAYSRLQPGCKVVSDTYGMCIGETEEAKTPIAVTGRVLAYPYRVRTEYELGAAVCSAPDGTVDIMTRDEIIMYPERIIGTVSEIPDYNVWHAGERDGNHEIEVNGRIWIYVR